MASPTRGGRVSNDAVLELIEAAYRAAEEPAKWGDFLLALSDTLGARTGVLLWHDLVGRGGVLAGARNDPQAAQAYAAHYASIDPRATSPAARTLKLCQAVPDEALAPYLEVQKTAYHNEFSLRYDISRMMTVVFDRADRDVSALTLLRADKDSAFSAESVKVLSVVSRHVQRALRICQTLGTLRSERDALLDAFDDANTAVFIAGGDSKLILTNRAGRELLQKNDGIRCDRGVLRGDNGTNTDALHRAIARTASAERAGLAADPGHLLLQRRSGGRALQVWMAPAADQSQLNPVRLPRAVLVFVSDPDRTPLPRAEVLQTLFGLTAMEAKVAVQLSAAMSTNEIAAELQLTRETCRWYVKQVLGKLACRGRSDVVRLLARLSSTKGS